MARPVAAQRPAGQSVTHSWERADFVSADLLYGVPAVQAPLESGLVAHIGGSVRPRTFTSGIDLPSIFLYSFPINTLGVWGKKGETRTGGSSRTSFAKRVQLSISLVGKIIRSFLSDPWGFFLNWIKPVCWGGLLKARHLLNPNISIGWFVKLYCSVSIVGPGKVNIGNHVQFNINSLDEVQIITTSKDAHVTIGDYSVLGGVKILCAKSVAIGAHCMFAKSFVSDIDFATESPGLAEPIVVEDHCWVSGDAGLLKNSSLGLGSTLGIGSVLSGKRIEERFLAIGRPARAVAKISVN